MSAHRQSVMSRTDGDNRLRARLWLLILFLLAACGERAADVSGTDERFARVAGSPVAAAAMPDRYSAAAVRAILRAGGNAVDAAVAASFVLAVTYPEAGNIGGGGFMTLYMDGAPQFLDYRETAPAAASRDMYLDEDGKFRPGLSQIGALASGVPGSVAGLAAAHDRYGSLAWRDLVAPAIALARDGFVVPDQLAKRIASKADEFKDAVNFSEFFKAKAGARLVQPALADTLERIANDGTAGFYRGRTASLITATMQAFGGLITTEDLAGYRAKWRTPLVGRWYDLTIVSAPPPSSGGVALLQLLGMKRILADRFEGLAHNSAGYVHLIAEMEKRVFADRGEYLGDPDFSDIPVSDLIAPAYLRARAEEVKPDAISATDTVKAGLAESRQTTHFSIVDFDGNAASVTTTLNGSFGSGVVVEGAGFLLNNEMDDFSAKPGAPNMYGVIGGEANAIAPGKRMLSSMTPTLVLRGDRVAMALGTPGGPTIFTTVFQAIINHTQFDMNARQTVTAGRFHHQLFPENVILFERRIAGFKEKRVALEMMGYRIFPNGGYGDLGLISIAQDGTTEAAADPRGRGRAIAIEAQRPSRN